MEALNELLATHGLWIIFLIVLLDQGGLPIPAWPPLIIASAQAVEQQMPVWPILLVAAVAALVADIIWYHAGRRFGSHMLGLICRVSLSPDSCVSSTRAIYAKWGPPSLILAKFIPGFAAVGTTLAGQQRTPLHRFAMYDGAGALLWSGAAVGAGALFHDAVNEALLTLDSLGRIGIGLVLVALLAFIVHKAWKRMVFMRELRMERITAAELRALFDDPQRPLVVDVRSEAERAATGWIPGAVQVARVSELAPATAGEVVIYCDCPNEASAARLASQLKQLGFQRVRPLAGGLEAWRSHGFDIEAPAGSHQASA
ncbi:MAG: rhodanese-like domain-containing protein [Burkholderiaceae bacterium]